MPGTRLSQRSDRTAARRLRELFPDIGPWTSAALWFGHPDPLPVPQTPLENELAIICEHKLAGLALRYLRSSGAQVAPGARDVLQRSAFDWSRATVGAVTGTDTALTLLRNEGIHGVVTKGPGVARFYPGADCRPYSDIDLLLSPRDFGRAVTVLEGSGWAEEVRNRQPWGYFRRWCREGLNLRDASDGSVDLHHRVPPWIWSAGLTFEAFATSVHPVPVTGRVVQCASAVDNLLVVALHVVSDRNEPGRSLLVWRDVVELANAAPVDEVVRAARQAGLTGWLRAVLMALPRPFGTEALLAALPDVPIPHAQRLGLLLSPRRRRFGVLTTQVLRLPVANGVGFVAGMTVPSPSYLAAKYPESRHRYAQWWAKWQREEYVVAPAASGE